MALLEEVVEGADESAGDAESLKAAHRRKRSKGANKKKKKTEVSFIIVVEKTHQLRDRDLRRNSYDSCKLLVIVMARSRVPLGVYVLISPHEGYRSMAPLSAIKSTRVNITIYKDGQP